ncbi:uncharacterized protein (UPF0332 family) [Granulicella aggregans]|uniref:Uncharacterized protein (UPF0332 family) n=1 Tax=Granulicella aggregans TaxID=474949 RepID=A0A7W8E3M7_9BACT|nr:HEPN domain-containing protein [Granulicella aggregans]MBB5057737.1 uncharacterized protein (UPF0332 family) [Granulicella aggregans]
MGTEPFDWTNYQVLANELVLRTEESCLRTAIGRAYYFALHSARKCLLDNGRALEKGANSHQWVWNQFAKSENEDCKKLAQIASRLKQKRITADYEDQYHRISDDAEQVISAAQDFASRLALLPKDCLRAEAPKNSLPGEMTP